MGNTVIYVSVFIFVFIEIFISIVIGKANQEGSVLLNIIFYAVISIVLGLFIAFLNLNFLIYFCKLFSGICTGMGERESFWVILPIYFIPISWIIMLALGSKKSSE